MGSFPHKGEEAHSTFQRRCAVSPRSLVRHRCSLTLQLPRLPEVTCERHGARVLDRPRRCRAQISARVHFGRLRRLDQAAVTTGYTRDVHIGTPAQRGAAPLNTSPEPATLLGVTGVGCYQRRTASAVARRQHLTASRDRSAKSLRRDAHEMVEVRLRTPRRRRSRVGEVVVGKL